MKISIIIPVYNVESYIEDCVLSVQELQQELEIVLVDDGSTDESGRVCDKLALYDKRIVVIHQKNKGLSGARNTGIRVSSGEYIIFLDADDFLDSSQTNEMLKKIKKEKPVISLGLYQNYYDKECEMEYSPAFMKLEGNVSMDKFLHMMPKDGSSCYMIACRFIVQRKYLLKYNLFFCDGIYHEDEEWTCRLLCKAHSIFITHNLFYLYRQNRKGSITSQVEKKHILDSVIVLDKLNSLIKEENISEIKRKYILNRMAQIYINILLNIYALDDLRERKKIYSFLENYQKLCWGNMSGKDGKSIKISIYILGLEKTGYLLMTIKKYWKRIDKYGYNHKNK